MKPHNSPRIERVLQAASATVREWDAFTGADDSDGHEDRSRFGWVVIELDNALRDLGPRFNPENFR